VIRLVGTQSPGLEGVQTPVGMFELRRDERGYWAVTLPGGREPAVSTHARSTAIDFIFEILEAKGVQVVEDDVPWA